MKFSLSYTDPNQLSETLQELDQVTRITQLELGEGNYVMSHQKSTNLAIAEISATKTLLYEGWGTDWSVDFNWITPHRKATHFGYCEGYEMRANSIAGFRTFNSSPGGSWGKYSDACSSTACMLNRQILIQSLEDCNALNALENLTNHKGIDTDNQAFAQLKRLTRRELTSEIVSSAKYYDLIIACLETGSRRKFKKSDIKNQRLLGEIVDLSHDIGKMRSPLTLSEVCQYLDASQASLYRVCQDTFGMGIIEMMTQVRLEEARRALLYKRLEPTNDRHTVKEIALSYGFKHQGRFSRRYFTNFGELPSQTLERDRMVSFEKRNRLSP